MTAPWTCPLCAAVRETAFCAACGEAPIKPRDLSLPGLAGMVYTAFSPVDGKVLRSFRQVLTRPGGLTRAFQDGLRKPFIGPFQIFLLANVLFFAVQSFSDTRVFTSTLEHRLLDNELWSGFGRSLLDQRLAATGRTYAQYAPVFDQAVAVNAKSLIGLMVPFLALLLPLVFWRAARPLAVHVVFSLHFYTFLMCLWCLPLGTMIISKSLGAGGVPPLPIDQAISLAMLLASAVYLYVAAGPVYGARGTARVIQAAVLATGVTWIFLGYRFLLLPITLYTT